MLEINDPQWSRCTQCSGITHVGEDSRLLCQRNKFRPYSYQFGLSASSDFSIGASRL